MERQFREATLLNRLAAGRILAGGAREWYRVLQGCGANGFGSKADQKRCCWGKKLRETFVGSEPGDDGADKRIRVREIVWEERGLMEAREGVIVSFKGRERYHEILARE